MRQRIAFDCIGTEILREAKDNTLSSIAGDCKCEETLDPLRGPIRPLDTGTTPIDSLHEEHLMALDTFLQDYPYITGYTPSTADVTLQQRVMKQFPWLSLDPQNKCKPMDIYMRARFPLPLPELFTHLSRWVTHMASISEGEVSALPTSDQTDDRILHVLLQLRKARNCDGVRCISLFSFQGMFCCTISSVT